MEKPIPYISNDNFSQEGIFDYWNGKLSGHAHVKRTYPDVQMSLGCGDSSMVALDLEAGLSESLLQLENSMMLSRKALWTRRWKAH